MSSDYSVEVAPEPQQVPSVGILIAISTLSPLAMNIYLPSMSGMMDAFSASSAEIQLTMSFYFIAVAVAQIVLGPLSDQYGRRPVIVGGMVLFVIGSVLCLLAPTVEALIAARIVQAAGGGAGLVLGRAMVRDVYERDKAASMIGYVTMGMAVAPTVGPVIGGYLDAFYGWQGGFIVMLVFGIGVSIATWLLLPETNHQRGQVSLRKIGAGYSALAREKMFWAYCFCAVGAAWLYFAYLGGVPFLAADLLHMKPSEMGLYFMIVALGYIAGNFITGRIAARIGVTLMIAAGTFVALFGTGLLVVVSLSGILTPPLLFMPMFFIGLGNGICLPSAISGAVSIKPEFAGTASALTSFLQIGIGAVVSTLVAGLISTDFMGGGAASMIFVMLVGSVFSVVFVAIVFSDDG